MGRLLSETSECSYHIDFLKHSTCWYTHNNFSEEFQICITFKYIVTNLNRTFFCRTVFGELYPMSFFSSEMAKDYVKRHLFFVIGWFLLLHCLRGERKPQKRRWNIGKSKKLTKTYVKTKHLPVKAYSFWQSNAHTWSHGYTFSLVFCHII